MRTLLCHAILISGIFLSRADQVPADDIVFKALGDELKRSMTLHLEDLEKPYFIQYTVEDSVTYHVSATYGSILRSGQDHSRVLHSQVRVGSYELDNSNFSNPRGGGGRRSLALTVELPLKTIVRGYSWTVVPITWRNRRTGVAKLKIQEMGSRYLFICLYLWLEKHLSRGDYKKEVVKQEDVPRQAKWTT